jgi:hypothetical protein
LSDTASLENWIGRTQQDEDEVCLTEVRRLAAMLDQDSARYSHGSELPESWYAILFGPIARKARSARMAIRSRVTSSRRFSICVACSAAGACASIA